MATARELIRSSLRLLNVIARNEDVDGEQIEIDMLAILNRLIETLTIEGNIPFNDEFDVVSLSKGFNNYSTTNFYGLKYTYIVDGDYDYPMEIISHEEYFAIMNKTNEGRPTKIYYNNNNNYADLYFYPTPDKSYSAKLISNDKLSTISVVTDTMDYPLGYDQMFLYNLAVLAAPEFLEGAELNPFVVAEAQKSLERIRVYNEDIPPKKVFDPTLSKTTYNILNGYQS